MKDECFVYRVLHKAVQAVLPSCCERACGVRWKTFLDFAFLQICCSRTSSSSASEVMELICKRKLIGVLCVPQCIFLLKPSEKCLIEILSLPEIIAREADECCGKRLFCSLEIFFPFRSWSKPESTSHTGILLRCLVLDHPKI